MAKPWWKTPWSVVVSFVLAVGAISDFVGGLKLADENSQNLPHMTFGAFILWARPFASVAWIVALSWFLLRLVRERTAATVEAATDEHTKRLTEHLSSVGDHVNARVAVAVERYRTEVREFRQEVSDDANARKETVATLCSTLDQHQNTVDHQLSTWKADQDAFKEEFRETATRIAKAERNYELLIEIIKDRQDGMKGWIDLVQGLQGTIQEMERRMNTLERRLADAGR